MANLLDIRMSVDRVNQYRELSAKLKNGRNDLRKQLRQQIAEAAKPAVDDVKATVTSLNVTSSHGGGSLQRRRFNAAKARSERAAANALRRRGGLRQDIAKATTTEITARGVRIVVKSNRLPENQRNLPRHLDSEKGWRHPLFGNKERWYDQRGGPYFGKVISRHAPEFRRGIQKAIDDTNKQIES